MPSGKKHKEFKTSSSGSAEVVLGGGTYMKKDTPGNVLGKIDNIFDPNDLTHNEAKFPK